MQSSADTIFILTEHNKASQLQYYTNGFIIMQSVKNYYDQIKGNKIIAYMKNNEIDFMDVKGNAESIYYGKNDNNKLLGQNTATCSTMKIFFTDKKVDVVKFIYKPVEVPTYSKSIRR